MDLLQTVNKKKCNVELKENKSKFDLERGIDDRV